ncbi:MAG: alpha/beta hydrolase, partial [Muribaculaceae bacterium]|nr:alpha/beta hydrolase [Muribaculaceae bacterium]
YCNLISAIFDNEATASVKLESSNLPAELKQNLKTVVQQMDSPYMKYFVALDPSKKLGSITCPVLALNGKKDTQVFHQKNLEALIKRLPKNERNQIIALEDLNHLFQHCQTGASTEYGQIEETISPEVLTLIIDFIKRQ